MPRPRAISLRGVLAVYTTNECDAANFLKHTHLLLNFITK